MECISPSHVPMIVQSEAGQDWAKQHILGEELRLGQAKQPGPLLLTHPALNVKTWSTRQGNTSRRTILYIPGAQPPARVEKKRAALRTPTKGDRSAKEWEDLLKSSMSSLHGLYARIEPPAPQKSRHLGHRLARPDLAGLDRTEMVSRALQAAIGSPSCSGQQQVCYDGDLSGSEDSYCSEDAPATPDTISTRGDASIDPRLLG